MYPIAEIEKSPALLQVDELLKEGHSALFEELLPSAKAYLLSHIADLTDRPLLILTGAGPEEFKLYNDLPFFSKKPLIEIPAWETLPCENIPPSPDIVGSRYKAFRELLSHKNSCTVLTSLQGCLQKVVPPEEFQKQNLKFKQGEHALFDATIAELTSLGFERKNICADKAEFAVRGGIIDLFPVTSTEPYRIEFWGDEIDSIRAFDPGSQKSHRLVDAIEVGAAKELEFVTRPEKELETIFSYLGANPIIVLDDLEALEDRYASLISLGATSSKNFLGIEEFFSLIEPFQKIFFTNTPLEKLSQVTFAKSEVPQKFYSLGAPPHEVTFEMFSKKLQSFRFYPPFESLDAFLEREGFLPEEIDGDSLLDACLQNSEKVQTIFVCQNEQEISSLKKKIEEKGHLASKQKIVTGYLSQGFAIRDLSLVLFPMTTLTHRFKIRREQQRTGYHFTATDAFDISPGELVVHYNHGIGKFLSIEKRPNHLGVEQEFFLIEYQEGSKLYVPLAQAHLITKYIGSHLEMPKLHAIGSNRWKKCREQTEKAIIGYAADLLKIYAERHVKGGFAYPLDSGETKAFDEEFPYIETDDQLQAIQEVKNDMSSPKAMDRLVCGDVGYGKTEVALRAAFKAVLDGKKQVAMLVPTTVLAVQHYENFVDRMESFGIHVALLCRFQKPKEVKTILEGVSKGTVDILIGTHRILGQDVSFKDLGLIIIDEEQRFGVKAKEHLKKMKAGVDCLTLTATPIPRTLYLSLVGGRDLSVINTPPQDRLPIKTIISDPDETTIRTALLRELNRDGQAYFIHNRVESIYEMANKIKTMLPKARIVVGHGQMDAEDSDLVFHAFKKGDADILIATSIVENGIDIPNANTIIVNDADRFGVSDLYQLRGRVGRWNRRAYAYFLIPKNRSLSEIARKRIETIAQAGGYGGGMKVAMRDLEMRGAGDILGIEQSGHVSEIGFHLYCKLLKRTIDGLQGKAPSWTLETKVEIPFDARLPEFYVNDVMLRMEIYQRLGDATALDEIDSLFQEMQDRFGKPPEQALWLYHLSRVRLAASQRGYTLIRLDQLSCSYERKVGASSISNKVLVGKIKDPRDFEQKLMKILLA